MRSCTTRPTTATPTRPTCASSCPCSTTRASTASRCSARPTSRTSGTPSRRPYSAMARDVYEEGAVILPCVKVQSDYQDIDDVIRMCQVRIRVPVKWKGDYLALLGAARVGEREVTKLAGEVGWDRLDAFVSAWLDYSEGRMAEAIRRLPNGRLTVHTRHDPFERVPDGVPLTITVGHLGRRDRGRPARQPRLPAVRPQPDRGDRALGGDAGRDERHQRVRARQRRHVPAGCTCTCARTAWSASPAIPRAARSRPATCPTASATPCSGPSQSSRKAMAWPRSA